MWSSSSLLFSTIATLSLKPPLNLFISPASYATNPYYIHAFFHRDQILPLQPFCVTKTYQFSSPCMATFVSIAPNPCVSSLSISAAFRQSVPNPITYPRLVPEICHSRYNIRKLHWSIICWTRVRKNVCCIYLWLLVTKTDGWVHWHKDMCIYRVLDLWLLYWCIKRESVCVRRIDKWNVR